MLESKIEGALIASVREAGGLCEKWGWQGWPDRIVCLPGGRVGFIELKRPGKTLEKLQALRLQSLRGVGCTTGFASSYAAVDRFVAELACST